MPNTDPQFTSSNEPAPPPVTKPQGEPYTETREFGTMSILAAFAVGAALGAGAALLAAPESGRFTRHLIKRRVRKLTRRERSTWKRLKRTMALAVAARSVKAATPDVSPPGD